MTSEQSTVMATSPAAGTRVLVTGAAGGLGRAIVAALTQARCRVAAVDRPSAIERESPAGVELAFGFDLCDPAAVAAGVERAAAALGGLDAVVASRSHDWPASGRAVAASPTSDGSADEPTAHAVRAAPARSVGRTAEIEERCKVPKGYHQNDASQVD